MSPRPGHRHASRRRALLLAACAGAAIVLAGCYALRPSDGAGEVRWQGPRGFEPADIALPPGYQIELVADELTFPTGIAWDDRGRAHVVESGYSYGEVFTEPRLLRLEPDGTTSPVTRDADGGPWTGVTFHDGAFFIADGNVRGNGRILKVDPATGKRHAIVDGLPSAGDHHTNGPVFGPDGRIYFGQGTATNSGIVGEDNLEFGWLARRPDFHDVPGADITLAGENYDTPDVRQTKNRQDRASTGAFLPFGTPSTPGQVIRGQVKCGGAILRAQPDGSGLELVAWGLRNPFGLAFAPDGTLFVSDNAADERGSRPIWGAPDVLWRVDGSISWYGWPDYVAGIPAGRFRPPGSPPVRPLLASNPNPPPRPVARFAVHASADGLDFSRNDIFGHAGEAFVAIFGDQAPTVGKTLAPVGGRVVRVDVTTGVITDFAVNHGPVSAPASKLGRQGLERPVAVRFDPAGTALYVVDFGVLTMSAEGSNPRPGTGAIWRITRSSP